MFKEKDGTFSWRKGLAFVTACVFVFSCVGYVFFECRQLPIAYTSIIGGVFAFYFSKELFKKKSDGNK
jgi:hypothetical protein